MGIGEAGRFVSCQSVIVLSVVVNANQEVMHWEQIDI
jgi:hypothetical protein